MMPDLDEYKWIIPDFIWELDEHIDLGITKAEMFLCIWTQLEHKHVASSTHL